MRNEAPSWMLGNVSCGAAATGSVSLRNVLTLALQRVDEVAAGRRRPRAEHAVVAVGGVLPLRRGPDGALDRAGRRVGGPLAGVASREAAGGATGIESQ